MDHQPLAERWYEEAETIRQYDPNSPVASTLAECARQLQEYDRAEESKLLTLKEAAAFSGYTKEHLSHLISEGTLRNHGRRGSPLLKKIDLPKKPASNGKKILRDGKPNLVGQVLEEEGLSDS